MAQDTLTGKYYTAEKHTQILIALMKAHGVRKIVASPGTTNICLVGSLQQDPYFELYSSVDERSAAYIACGIARESGEPVALSCTGATASRNYVPGLTEAYYSNLPVLAITSTQYQGRVGHLYPQVIDRSEQMNDIVKKSIQLQEIHTREDEWNVTVSVNDALLELRRHGGGPVHINLMTTYSSDFSVKELPAVRMINRYSREDELPSLEGKRIQIYVGTHIRWTRRLTEAVDMFCECYNAVVLCEHISNYRGKYGVYPALLASQEGTHNTYMDAEIMIHIGQILGAGAAGTPAEVWRVHPDGEVRDTFKKLTKVFEMEEEQFFEYYVKAGERLGNRSEYYEQFHNACLAIQEKVPELPFSNAWIAKNTVSRLPQGCELHLGILNTLRTWSLFGIDHEKQIEVYSNTGGFGIDGMLSSLLGTSLASPDKLCFGIIGDLAFFYDMNAAGNRHVGKNIRVMVINNGRGTEFRNYNHPAQRFEEAADPYMAAAGHYGNQSPELIKHYAQDLGYEYMCASGKEEYLDAVDRFFSPESQDRPMIFEVFTDSVQESEALKILYRLDIPASVAAKNAAKTLLGDKGVDTIKKLLGR